MYEHGLVCGITDYTRIEYKKEKLSKTCIDHIFARARSQELYSATVGIVLADHRMIVVSCIGAPSQQGTPKLITRFNKDKLIHELQNINWKDIILMSCANKIYTFIKGNIMQCYDKSKYQYKLTNSKRNREGWINNKIARKETKNILSGRKILVI